MSSDGAGGQGYEGTRVRSASLGRPEVRRARPPAVPGCSVAKQSSGLTGGRVKGGFRSVSCRPTRAEARTAAPLYLGGHRPRIDGGVASLGEVRVRRAQREEADGVVPLPAPPRPSLQRL